MGESDALLLAATSRGDADAFATFYRRYERRIMSYAMSRCVDAGDVADLTSETFLAALRAAGRFADDGEDATAWLYGIARRVLARQRRSFVRRQRLARRLEALPTLTPDESDAVGAAIDAARLAPAVAAALSTLKPKDQELLRLVSSDGLSPAQAGAVLGLSANAARVRLSRARSKVRAQLESTAHPPSSSTQQEVPHA